MYLKKTLENDNNKKYLNIKGSFPFDEVLIN